MDSEEESSTHSTGIQAIYGNPQYVKDGAMVYGLDVDSEHLPPLKMLLGRYAWFETGVEQPCGPQLDKGVNLRLKSPDGPAEFPNLHADFSLLEEVGIFTAVRRGVASKEDPTPCWEFDVQWTKPNKAGRLLKGRLYVGTVLDDNGAPFLEVVFGDQTDPCIPYGYAKRQTDDGDTIGLSEAEKKRLNFLTNAQYDALMEAKEAKERRPIELKIQKEMQEREERERVRREKEKRDNEIRRKNEENRQAQLLANKANGILTKKERKRLEQEKRTAENKLKASLPARELRRAVKGAKPQEGQARQVASMPQQNENLSKKQRKAQRETLARQESMYDLLKNPPQIASGSCIVGQASTQQTPSVLPIQRWPGIKQEPVDVKLFANSVMKQEPIPPSLHLEGHRGTKRSHPDDPEDSESDFKRLKLEY